MEIIDKLSQEAISSIEELEEGRLVEVVEGIDAGLNTAKQISESYNDDGCDMEEMWKTRYFEAMWKTRYLELC